MTTDETKRNSAHFDGNAIVQNAAGIADAFRCCQFADSDGDNQMAAHLSNCNGWMGIIRALADSAATMEEFRINQRPVSQWGLNLPSVYLAWDALGRALWYATDLRLASGITEQALEETVSSYEEWCNGDCAQC